MFDISPTLIESIARASSAQPGLQVTQWSIERVLGGAGDAHESGLLGVYRVKGQGYAGERAISWSAIVKSSSASTGGAIPADLFYWLREAELYRSDVLERLPTPIMAPRCFAVTFPADDVCWVWLEDIVDAFGGDWPIEHYGVVAGHFGIFGGQFLQAETLPAWLCHGRRASWLAMSAAALDRLPELRHHPRIERWLTHVSYERLMGLWQRRDALQQALARLPQTFCHHDVFKRNLFARRQADGAYATVAIDWTFAGYGAVGEDIASLVAATVLHDEVPTALIQRLDEIVFAGYLRGLAAAQATLDRDVVRAGYALSAAVTHLLAACWYVIPAFAGETMQRHVEQIHQAPIDRVLERWAPVHIYLLALADEGIALAEKLGLM